MDTITANMPLLVFLVVGTIAVLKFFRYGDLGEPGEDVEPHT